MEGIGGNLRRAQHALAQIGDESAGVPEGALPHAVRQDRLGASGKR
jgi:hypothetical protein